MCFLLHSETHLPGDSTPELKLIQIQVSTDWSTLPGMALYWFRTNYTSWLLNEAVSREPLRFTMISKALQILLSR